MNLIIENWYLIVASIAATVTIVALCYRFYGMPSEEQKTKVKEWLIWACIEAEKALQSGTGQLKLRFVYDKFIAVPSFSWIAKMISFEVFSSWVASSLDVAKSMLVNNPDLAKYVYGKNATTAVQKLKDQLDTK